MAINFYPLVVVEHLHNGKICGYPAAAPTLKAIGDSKEDVVTELKLFLGELVNRDGLSGAAKLEVSSDYERTVLTVEIPMEIPDRPVSIPIRFHCLIVEDDWTLVLATGQFVYTRPHNDEKLSDNIRRHVSALGASPRNLANLFPPRFVDVFPLTIKLDPDATISKAKDAQKKEKVRKATLLLREIGKEVVPEPRPALVQRDEERDALRAIMCGKTRLSTVVIGPSGSGKSELIRQAISGEKRIVQTSGAQLVAGQSYFGQWQKRVHDVMAAAQLLDCVIWFDDFADLFSNKDGSSGMSSVIRNYLAERKVRITGELRPEDVERAAQSNYGFYQNLHPIRLPKMDKVGAVETLRSRRAFYQSSPQPVRFTDEAIAATVSVVDRYTPYGTFPGKSIELYESIRKANEDPHFGIDVSDVAKSVEESEVYTTFSRITGVPNFMLQSSKPLDVEHVESTLHHRVIGQRSAIRSVAETVCAIKANLQPGTKPLANFLFVGPTGVGKTEVARALAKYLFASPDRMIRFDMSEYTTPNSVERLITGTGDDDGLLTRAIRKQPFSVVLFDEIEKADPNVFDLLLQVLGEGRLSDAKGRTSYFHNAIVIMTSNLGATASKSSFGFSNDRSDSNNRPESSFYHERVEEHFRPEFVNRLDRIVGFSALTETDIQSVTDIALTQLTSRPGLEERGVTLDFDDEVRDRVAALGHSLQYGARHLHRFIDRHLSTPIAHLVSEHADSIRNAEIEIGITAPELDSQTIATIESAHFFFTAKRTGALDKRVVRDVSELTKLRQNADFYIESETIEVAKDREAYLSSRIAALASLKGDEDTGQQYSEIGKLVAERKQLRDVLSELDTSVESIAGLEELAISQALAGESATSLLDLVPSEMKAFFSALAAALLVGTQKRKRIVLGAFNAEGDGLLKWFPAFVEGCAKRDWPLKVVQLIPNNVYEPLPNTAPLTDPKSILKTFFESPNYHLLIDVENSVAASLLATEAGLFEFADKDESAKVMIRVISFIRDVTWLLDSEKLDGVFQVPERLPLGNRKWKRQGDQLTFANSVLRLNYEKEYYDALEQIFSLSFLHNESSNAVDHPWFDESDELGEVIDLVNSGKKIAAIKLYRELTGCSLAKAKEEVEALESL